MPSRGRGARRRAALALLVVGGLLAASAGAGEIEAGEPTPPVEKRALPGVELATTLATVTGIAITPLLGVSAVGAWHYYRADPERRGDLPWYAARWFWLPGLFVALLLVFKDPLLGVVPGVKKPLDALDVLENKISAVLAAPAVVPMIVSAFSTVELMRRFPGDEATAVAQAGLGDLPHAALLGLGAAVFLAAFFCIWLAFHAINVLILLSPFGPLDLLLRSVKLAVLGVLAGATALHPYLGLAVALAILLVSIPLAAWSFRLMVFGGVLAVDLVTGRHRRRRRSPDLRVFTARRIGAARVRTYGTISLEDSALVFRYRPWLVLPRRRVPLPAGAYRLGRGLVCPTLLLEREGGARDSLLRFPPRYRTHEETVAAALGLSPVEDLPLLRGLKACAAWFRDLAGRDEGEAAAPT